MSTPDRSQPPGFIPALPSRYRVRFLDPRSIQRSGTATLYTRTGGVGYWAGSFKLPPQLPMSRLMRDGSGAYLSDDGTPMHLRVSEAKKTLAFIRSRDINNGFFFADVVTVPEEDHLQSESYNLPEPDWLEMNLVQFSPSDTPIGFNARRTFSVTSGTDYDNLITMEEGDIASFRRTTSSNAGDISSFVTARMIMQKQTVSNKTFFELDFPLPSEYTTSIAGITHELCHNRPHVRAVFVRNATSWQVGNGFLDVDAIEWVEDSVRNIASFLTSTTTYVFGLDQKATPQFTDDDLFLLNVGGETFFYDLA